MKKYIFIILFTLFIQSVNALTEAPIDVLSMSINEIQEARSKNIITYEQLTKIYLDRINEYNKIYNSYITINDKAIDEAKAMDKLYKEKGLISKMMGIPIAVKDNIDVYGMPTTAGTKSLSDNYPNEDADVIKKLRNAGTIFLGKTNMSELAFSARISKSSYGHTYNAYNTKYTPYGSSGGSASVVGSALAVAALGTDTSASIRTPSSANNAYGLRPTTSLLSGNGIIKYDIARDTVGPITKYANDAIIMMSIMNDKTYKSVSLDLSNYRIGVMREFMSTSLAGYTEYEYSTDPDIVNLMNQAIDNLKELGAEIVDIDNIYSYSQLSINRSTTSGISLCSEFNLNYINNTTGTIRSFDQLAKSSGHIQALGGYNKKCYPLYSSTDRFKNMTNKRMKLREYIENKMDEYKVDILIYPTTKNKVLTIEETSSIGVSSNSPAIAPTAALPSMNVPIGFIDDLPYGMELLSKHENESVILDIANVYNNKVNYYILPTISPSLYNTYDNINELLEYYNKEESKYNRVHKKTKEFFLNYNNIDNKEETINNLIKDYKHAEKYISINNIFKSNNKKYIYIDPYILLLIININILLYRYKNKKKY